MGTGCSAVLGSLVFAVLTAILGKDGITGVECDLETAMCTVVVLMMTTVAVAVARKAHEGRTVPS